MSPDTDVSRIPQPDHIGVIVKDIDKTAELLSSTLGIVFHENLRNLVADKRLAVGKPHRFHAVHAKLGPIGFELLQPLDEDSALGQFLKIKGEGLHHIAFDALNWDEVVTKLIVRGSKVLQGGIASHTPNVNRWADWKTGSGGIIVQLAEKKVEAGAKAEGGTILDVELGETKVEGGINISPDTDVLSLPDPDRISVIVKDIDETAEFLSSTLGIVFHEILRNLVYEKMTVGKPFSLHAAHANLGPIGFELLQPLDEESMLGQFLKTKGEGLHHIAFKFSNWDEVVSKLKKQGSKILLGGINPWGKRYCYFKTKLGGMVIEFDEKV